MTRRRLGPVPRTTATLPLLLKKTPPSVSGGSTRQAEPSSGPVTVSAMNGPCHGRNDGDVTAPPMALRRPRATRFDAAPTFPRGGVPHSPPRFAGAVFFLGLLYQRPIPLRQQTGLTMPPRLGNNWKTATRSTPSASREACSFVRLGAPRVTRHRAICGSGCWRRNRDNRAVRPGAWPPRPAREPPVTVGTTPSPTVLSASRAAAVCR